MPDWLLVDGMGVCLAPAVGAVVGCVADGAGPVAFSVAVVGGTDDVPFGGVGHDW